MTRKHLAAIKHRAVIKYLAAIKHRAAIKYLAAIKHLSSIKYLAVIMAALALVCCGALGLRDSLVYDTALGARDSLVYDEVLRLHVQANSDSLRDQALKLAVRDAVVEYMQGELMAATDLREAQALARERREAIAACAVRVLRENGCADGVEVIIGGDEFPEKAYGELVLPAGRYQAVRVIIGSGLGQNWWCVLFPPLCLLTSAEDGLSLSDPQERRVAFKCLELLPEGLKISLNRPAPLAEETPAEP